MEKPYEQQHHQQSGKKSAVNSDCGERNRAQARVLHKRASNRVTLATVDKSNHVALDTATASEFKWRRKTNIITTIYTSIYNKAALACGLVRHA